MKPAAVAVVCGFMLLSGVACARAAGEPAPPAKPLKITFYPILARVPIFGATIDIPPSESGGGGVSGTTDVSWNAAYMTGVSVESDRWFVEGQALWAALSAEHSLPHVSVDSDLYFFNARGGIRVARRVFATAGVRRVAVGLAVELTDPATSSPISGSTRPSLWDPLVGVDWRGSLGRGWTFDTGLQGGGFGVGTDVDLSADFYADRQFARHFGVRLGYTFMYFKTTTDNVQIGSSERTLVAKQSLHGPTIGFAIIF